LTTPFPRPGEVRESDPMEDRLREEQERFSFALEAAGMVAWEWDAASDRVVRSRNADRLLSLPVSGSGEEFLSLLHPEDRERVRRALERALSEGEIYEEEFRIVRPDGSVSWVADRGRMTRGSDGQPGSLAGVLRDVTASRQAEEELQRSEQRLHTALTTIPVTSLDPFGIYSAIRDASGRIVDLRIEYVNDAACKANGMAREEQVGHTVLDILPEHKESGLFDIYLRVIETGEPFETDAFLFQWGEPPQRRWFDIRATKLGDGFAAAWRDVTWRRESEESLRRSREHLQFVSDAAAVSVAHCDSDWRFVFVNQMYASRLGLTPDEIVGRTIPEVLGPRVAEAIRPHVERVLSGEPVRFETEVEYPQVGRRYVYCVYTPEVDAAGRIAGWVAAITDLTERHRLEETLRRSEESLKEADRRKDEFLATLAHELRNPLAPIRNAVQILRVRGAADPDLHSDLQWSREVIDRQVQQLTHLVDDLLDVSRITRGRIELRRERIELAAVLERALETSRPAVEAAHHRLTVTFPEGPVWVAADLTRMAQVLSNLINNAAKYTRSGGHIQVSASAADGQAKIEVRDDGIGIQPEMLSRIFDLFAQVDTSLERAQGGLGIGLTIARSLVEMHGGTIAASSAGLGQGSTFTIRLPLAQEEDVRAVPKADREQEAQAGLRVLVVDDNADSADSLAIWLRLKGHEVRTAYDGPQALAQALEQQPDLVLLDIGMPGMSGYEVARRMRAHPDTRRTVLVAMTGWGQEEDRRQSREAGIDQHLVKPLEPRALEDLIARLAARP
jgi:PAS domain S-box-containing protein